MSVVKNLFYFVVVAFVAMVILVFSTEIPAQEIKEEEEPRSVTVKPKVEVKIAKGYKEYKYNHGQDSADLINIVVREYNLKR